MMTQAKLTAQTEPNATLEESASERLLARLFRPNWLLAAALVGAAYALAPAAVTLVPDLSAQPEYRVKTAEILVPEPPPWVPASFLQRTLKQAELPPEISVLDPTVAERVGRAFESQPWVQGPVSVRVSVPARVVVTFEYRRPTAMVAVSDGVYPVDTEGRLLPPQDFPASEVGRYPRIVGIGVPPEGEVGQPWGDERIIGAARLATVIAPHWDEFQLASIELPLREANEQKYDDLQYVLTMKNGSRIIWGRAPGHSHPLEVADEQKIGRLKAFLAKGKSFDGPWEININHLMEISYMPLESPKPEPPGKSASPARKRR